MSCRALDNADIELAICVPPSLRQSLKQSDRLSEPVTDPEFGLFFFSCWKSADRPYVVDNKVSEPKRHRE